MQEFGQLFIDIDMSTQTMLSYALKRRCATSDEFKVPVQSIDGFFSGSSPGKGEAGAGPRSVRIWLFKEGWKMTAIWRQPGESESYISLVTVFLGARDFPFRAAL